VIFFSFLTAPSAFPGTTPRATSRMGFSPRHVVSLSWTLPTALVHPGPVADEATTPPRNLFSARSHDKLYRSRQALQSRGSLFFPRKNSPLSPPWWIRRSEGDEALPPPDAALSVGGVMPPLRRRKGAPPGSTGRSFSPHFFPPLSSWAGYGIFPHAVGAQLSRITRAAPFFLGVLTT